MPDHHPITQEGFDSLLGWLASTGEPAGEKYERIRRRLIKLFVCRGCHEPELLADRTIDRVILKVPQISPDFLGEPSAYFCRVAENIHHEWIREQKKQQAAVLIDPDPKLVEDAEFSCLDRCLTQLRPGDRELIIEYYTDEKRARIERRRDLADRLALSVGALQIKASRIRSRLAACVAKCAEQKKSERF